MASNKEDISLFNAAEIRNYCYVDDLIRALRKSIASEFNGFGIFNIGTGIGTCSRKLGRMIRTLIECSGNIIESSHSDRPKNSNTDHLVAGIEKIVPNKLKSETTLVDGLKKTIRSFLNG